MSTASRAALLVALIACSRAAPPAALPTSTITRETRVTTITTTTVPSTTTTIPPPVTLSLAGAPRGLQRAVGGLYLWAKDTSRRPPESLPAGLVRHLRDLPEVTKPIRVKGSAATADALGARVAVVTSAKDVILAVHHGEAWQIVGAKLARFGKGPWYGRSPRMVFVIGSDARLGQDPLTFRADSLHILSSVTSKRAGAVVGIPRDSWVEAPYGGSSKFTDIMALRGPEVILETATQLTGLPLEGYLITGFAGFSDMVDAFGGFRFDVPFAMADWYSKAYLDPGPQHFDGDDALAFSRNRHIPGGDFTRSLHQGLVIESALKKVQRGDIAELPGLLKILSEHTTTDLAAGELLTLVATAYEIDLARVDNVVVPGSVGSVGRASVVFLGEGASRTFEDLQDGLID